MKKMASVTDEGAIGRAARKGLAWTACGLWSLSRAHRPLTARVVGEIVHDDYVIEKIIYESQLRIFTSRLISIGPKPLPSGGPRWFIPAAIYDEAKANDDYQKVCIGLPRRAWSR